MMETVEKSLVTTQVILIALIGGLLVISGVMVYMVWVVAPGGFIAGKGPQWGGLPFMTTVLAGMGILILLLAKPLTAIVVRQRLIEWKKRASPPAETMQDWDMQDFQWLDKVPVSTLTSLLEVFQTKKITMAALCEGAGMLSAMVYLLEGYWVALGVVAVAIVLMAWEIPNRSNLNQWLKVQMGQKSSQELAAGI